MIDEQIIHGVAIRVALQMLVIALLSLWLFGCAYTGCNEAFYENLPGCPAQPVKLEGCRIYG